MNVIEINNLKFSYSGGNTVLHDISFRVFSGEIFVIAGLSGSGKTTLCRILCGIIPRAIKGTLSGQVKVLDIEPSETDLSQASLRIGMVFQDPDSQIISTAVEDELAFGLENLCRQPEKIQSRVDELLIDFGLRELRYANPAHLSGGQKKLLTIAAALAPSPPVLVLDEPMSGLDDEGRELVKNTILRLRRQGHTVMIVEHDLNPVAFANRWLLLHEGGIAACAAPSDILRDNNLLEKLGYK